MNKHVASAIAATLLALTGAATADPLADLSLDPYRMYFSYSAPSTGFVRFQMLPDNRSNPIVVPCDLQELEGTLDVDYLHTGPTVLPSFTFTYFDDHDNPITSSGCLNNQTVTSVRGSADSTMTAGSVQGYGYTTLSSVSPYCASMFQPSDLPPDKVVRMHMQVVGYTDNSPLGSIVPDPDLSNNGHDIYVRRSCSCN